jgi:RNase H-fold protein (predicted Holliday junction resolvase)
MGVAVGQLTTSTANSWQTIRAVNQAPNWQAIQALVNHWQPIGICCRHIAPT